MCDLKLRSKIHFLLSIIIQGTNWTLNNNIDCKVETGAAILSHIQNNALENDPGDCKGECKLDDGCVGFNSI